MGRKPSLVPTVKLHTALDAELHDKMTSHLFSELEGRVPHGAYQAFLEARIREFFSHRYLDLTPFGFPSGFHVSGPATMIEALESKLKGAIA